MENRLICICGPTASGKTALSVALAQQLHTEIISADSMQLYRGMDIGTAKPDMKEREGVPHHLFDVCEPGEAFSVARYVELADAAAQDILSRGMTPIVVGGTGLYMDALIECSVFSGDETDLTVREKYQRMAAEQGNQAVHDCLAKVDPAGAERLHPNNLKRVIRALEVYEQTGMTIDEFNRRNKRPEPKYDALKIGVCPSDREILYDRINGSYAGKRSAGGDETAGGTPSADRHCRAGHRLQRAARLSERRANIGRMYRIAQAAQQKLCKTSAYLAEKG